jgi:DNA-binding GntR family transcriptional regulator
VTLEGRNGPRTLADVALAELKRDIITGVLPPGSPIRLQEQVERLQMSSVPIREALRYLERSGLVDRTPHRGTHVAEMSAQDLEETYRIRQELEAMAVSEAARRIAPETCRTIEALVEEYAEFAETDPEKALEIHTRLHMSIYEESGSKWLMRLIPMLWDNSERYRRLALPTRGTVKDRIIEHRRIVELCKGGDAEGAAAALRDHLSHTFEVAIERLREVEGSQVEE